MREEKYIQPKRRTPKGGRRLAHHTPLLKIPVWWRRAVLPSLPWVVCFLSFPVLVPVRASPVPSVVRGSFVVKFSFFQRARSACQSSHARKLSRNVTVTPVVTIHSIHYKSPRGPLLIYSLCVLSILCFFSCVHDLRTYNMHM